MSLQVMICGGDANWPQTYDKAVYIGVVARSATKSSHRRGTSSEVRLSRALTRTRRMHRAETGRSSYSWAMESGRVGKGEPTAIVGAEVKMQYGCDVAIA